MNIGDRITQLRDAKGWKQRELAAAAGCPLSAVGMLESGENKSSKWLPMIAAALEVDAVWLATGEGDSKVVNRESADDLTALLYRHIDTLTTVEKAKLLLEWEKPEPKAAESPPISKAGRAKSA